ncbi:MAG: MFS transporter [Rhodobacteraceae bacterium]|nr:MFS transporter [Paracoccaceae bacterium]MBR26102.1 MFS transporter [Paracoccaceae bacterium]
MTPPLRGTDVSTGAPARPAGPGPVEPPEAQVRFAFIAMMSAMIAINAFAADMVIPGLGVIADHFALQDPNSRQWVIYASFLGMAVSQLLIGPLSDSLGRRPAAFTGLAVFGLGCILAGVAQDFETLLAGRVLQGLGSGGLRVLAYAILRDRVAGDEMARSSSLISIGFLILIFIAPMAGQLVIMLSDWRGLFAWLLIQSGLTALWLARALPETLPPERRRPLAIRPMVRAMRVVAATPATLACAGALAATLGSLATYIATAEQIFNGIYGLGALMPLAFGALALAEGGAAFFNSRAVKRIGALRMARIGLTGWVFGGSIAAAVFALGFDGVPPLWLFMLWNAGSLAMFALLFGNLNAVAMAPMGDMAGSASSVLAFMSTAGGALLAAGAGAAFDGTVVPLAACFAVSGAVGLGALTYAQRRGAFA